MAGIYIHIPFCESRCIYCGFYSTTSLPSRDKYVEAVCHEMTLRPDNLALGGNYPIETVYLGGGTPSQLTGSQLFQLFECLQQNYGHAFAKQMEVTMECNPDDVTDEFCETLSQLPINRISMGAQTFSDKRLQFLHRRHQAQEVKKAVERLRNIGIENISIDLMFGFPEETLMDWEYDLQQAIDLGVEHISAYSLMYEEGTRLYRLLEQKKVKEIDEELSLQMYDMLCDKLTKAGYEHYEISNFARPGYRSRHNSSYWHEIPYIGLGAAAHSYKREKEGIVERSWNVSNIQRYIDSILNGTLPSENEKLDINTRYNDLITTALRTSDGIYLSQMKKEFGENLFKQLLHDAKGKIERGLMEIKYVNSRPQNLRLTHKGISISDDIMGDFMIVDE